MKRITSEITLLASKLHGKNARLVFMVLTIGLFILAATAPNATIAVGK